MSAKKPLLITCYVCGRMRKRVNPETRRCEKDGAIPADCFVKIGGRGAAEALRLSKMRKVG